MFDFVQYILLGITLVLTLVFAGLLGLLCIRTRSIGLIIITMVLVFPLTLGLIPSYLLTLYIDQWAGGELNNWLTQRLTIEGFLALDRLGMRLIHDGLLVLGAFLIYREWRSGNIPWRHYKPSEVVNYA